MTRDEALQEVTKRFKFGSKLGLERIREFLEKLGNPQKKLKFVHVAGTNGKGTTCTYLASVLEKAGYRVGLYTSPYVVDFRERFKINSQMISEKELVEEIERITPAAESMEAEVTEFEYITALAFSWFARKNCDIVVLEVGLGGRFDATNIIDVPEAAVIASISLDHTEILGDTIEKIAFEKAGIIKEGTQVSMYPKQDERAVRVFHEICRERNSTLHMMDTASLKIGESNLFGTDFSVNGKEYHIPFSGEHQVYNALNALTALDILREKGWNITEDAIKSGLAQAAIAARMEILSREPLVLLDGGHNPGCAEALKDVIEKNLKGRNITAIIGIMADKDSRSYLETVVPLFNRVITVTPENPRSMPAEQLAELASEFCGDVMAAESNEEAVKEALKSDAVVVCGSFYMAGEIRPILMDNI